MNHAPTEPYVFAGDHKRTHREIRARAQRAARGFQALGLAEGDAVALLLRNDFVFFEASLAAKLAGAYPVPINWHSSPDDIAYILRDCAAKILVAHADLLATVHALVAPHVTVLVVETRLESEATDPDPAWEPWLATHDPIAEPANVAPTPVIYTSGTTGRPKGVRRAANPASRRSARALAVYGLDRGAPMRVLINGPMYHAVPNAYSRLAFQEGADIILEDAFEPEDMLALISRHRITHMHIVPAMVWRLLRLPCEVRRSHDLTSLRYVVHGAAHCPPALKRAMIDWWGPIVFEYYGSTETGLLTVHDSYEAHRKPGTVGRALGDVTLRIFDEGGREMPVGTIGEVYAGSANLHDFTYIGNDAKRAEIGRGDLVTAGDIGWLDEDGYLFLCDRKRDRIQSGEITIYPAEIEAAIFSFEAVKDCAVFGIEHSTLGEVACACVEPLSSDKLDAATVRAHLETRLDRSKMPGRIEIVANLPREDSGKIFKNRLREIYANADTSTGVIDLAAKLR